MGKNKSPFKNGTIEDVFNTERNYFSIQIGNDMYNKDGNFFFTVSQVEKYYNKLLNNIIYTIANGNEKQRDAAMKCLSRLYILPLRIH